MNEFKVGDVVKYIKAGALDWESADWPAAIGMSLGDTAVVTKVTSSAIFVELHEDIGCCPRHFKLVEESATMNTKDLYTHKHDGTIVCGDTAIREAKRKRDGEQQYIIAYERSKVMNGAVKHSDIPALIAALLDVYDGDVKAMEEEIPF